MSFDPITASLALLSAIGTGLEAASSFTRARNAARSAEKQGEMAMRQAEARAQQIERQAERALSSQLAASGASGVIPVLGSDLEVQLETAREFELARLDELYSGRIKKYNAKGRAQDFRRQGTSSLITGGIKTVGILGQSYRRSLPSKVTQASSVMGNQAT